MPAPDVDELVRIARDEPPYIVDDDCLTCGAAAGEDCTVECGTRGEEAVRAVRKRLAPLDLGEFVQVLRDARGRRARGDETPGFFWAWKAIEEEADERGTEPVGL